MASNERKSRPSVRAVALTPPVVKRGMFLCPFYILLMVFRKTLCSGSDVLQQLNHLLRCLCPGHSRCIYFLERVHNVFIMQGDVRRTHCRTVTRIKRRVPLLVLVTKADNRQVALFQQGLGADSVHLGRLVITPEVALRLTQEIACRVAGFVVGVGRGELNRQAGRLGTRSNLLAPVGMDFAGKVYGRSWWAPLECWLISQAGIIRQWGAMFTAERRPDDISSHNSVSLPSHCAAAQCQ